MRNRHQKKVLLYGQDRNYFLVSKITPRQTANTRQAQNYNGISVESMNTFMFTRLGTFTHVHTHLKRPLPVGFAFEVQRITCWKTNYSQIPSKTIH